MTYIICPPCDKDYECVEVCPVGCIHPLKDEQGALEAKTLYIDPEACIDCGICESVCPMEAIFEEDEVPEKWKDYIQINADHYKEKLNS